ncbi:protein phosphatase 2C domain-containing protein [Streptomyces sp. NPDC056486]|uniref:protein phosphatase 2C domain-containing protein n=1 Tax=Streptomyces sp. NPDC056486 TaxID=3345835 RepID=UPI0036C6596D
MSQQGETHDGASGQEDDWWGQLYDDSAHDTGPAEMADTLDDRFASAVSAAAGGGDPGPSDTVVDAAPPPGGGGRAEGVLPQAPEPAPPRATARTRPAAAPWEPSAAPTGPVTFPDAPKPLGGEAPGGEAPGGEAPGGEAPGGEPPGGEPESLPSRTTAVPAPRLPDASASPPGGVHEPREDVVSAPAVDAVAYVGDGPPTYDAEPTVLPAADPDDLGDLVADTVLDGARYGTSTLRAVSVRGDSARYRGEPRRDSLLTARFGTGDSALVLVAMATGARATPGAHRAAAEACAWIGRAVGRSHQRLSEDIRAARRGDLKSGLHRLTDRSLGKLRAHAADLGIEPEEYAASLRCLLLPADPDCRTRVFFGVGSGGLFRLRDGAWQDIEPRVGDSTGDTGPPVVGFGSVPPQTPDGDRLTMDMGIITPPSPYEPAPEPPPREPFRFRASVARPGDALLLCSGGLAEPLSGEPELAAHLTQRWAKSGPPGLATFLADIQVRVKGYADDRTAAAVWEA